MNYDIWIEPEVHGSRQMLPGNVRQRVKRIIDELAQSPRPTQSRPLDTADLQVPQNVEVRRIRLDRWRIIYGVNDVEGWVWVLSIRERPPYNYADLSEIIARLQ